MSKFLSLPYHHVVRQNFNCGASGEENVKMPGYGFTDVHAMSRTFTWSLKAVLRHEKAIVSYRYLRSNLYRKASLSIYVISLRDKDLQRNKNVSRENKILINLRLLTLVHEFFLTIFVTKHQCVFNCTTGQRWSGVDLYWLVPCRGSKCEN